MRAFEENLVKRNNIQYFKYSYLQYSYSYQNEVTRPRKSKQVPESQNILN